MNDNEECKKIYYGYGIGVSSSITHYNSIVTSTSTSTATSTLSQLDSDIIAQTVANNVAESNASNIANIIDQTVVVIQQNNLSPDGPTGFYNGELNQNIVRMNVSSPINQQDL